MDGAEATPAISTIVVALMNGCGIGRHQRVEFAKPVGDGPAIKARS